MYIREDKIIHTQVKTSLHKRSSSPKVTSRSGSRIFKGGGRGRGYRKRRRHEGGGVGACSPRKF